MEEIKTLSFFGEDGITSTSANHVANLAKEGVRKSYEYLSSIRCYTEKVGLLTSDRQAVVREGWSSIQLKDCVLFLNQIVEANSLIAFLREAIKEKERRMKEAEAWTDNRAMGDFQIRYGAFMATRPVKEAYPTEESVRQKWSVGEQEKYLSLEAEASVIGKFIHEDGYLSRARIDLMNRVNNPARVDVNGSETVVYSYEPTVSVQEVDDLFSSLQSRYRQVQAEVNGMKKKIDDYIFAEKMRIDSEHASALREWNVQNQHFADERKLLEEEEEIRRNELIKAVKALKIVIPKRLKSIYLLLTSK